MDGESMKTILTATLLVILTSTQAFAGDRCVTGEPNYPVFAFDVPNALDPIGYIYTVKKGDLICPDGSNVAFKFVRISRSEWPNSAIFAVVPSPNVTNKRKLQTKKRVSLTTSPARARGFELNRLDFGLYDGEVWVEVHSDYTK